MHQKLAALYHLFHSAEAKCDPSKVIALMTEILDVFGLPPNQGNEQILLNFCRNDYLTDAAIDQTLLVLAAEGTFHQTLSKLGEV
jgi:hypothetical protein